MKPQGGIRYVQNSGRVKRLRNHSSLPNSPTGNFLHTSVDILNERVKYAEVSRQIQIPSPLCLSFLTSSRFLVVLPHCKMSL
jgi:hypothetical protein